MLRRTHDVSGAVEAVAERRLEELHGEVHLVVDRERLHDAHHARERSEYAERRAPAVPGYTTLLNIICDIPTNISKVSDAREIFVVGAVPY